MFNAHFPFSENRKMHNQIINSLWNLTLYKFASIVYNNRQDKTKHKGENIMTLELNKEGAMFIQNAIAYYLKQGAKDWVKIMYPTIDLKEIFNQLEIIELAEN